MYIAIHTNSSRHFGAHFLRATHSEAIDFLLRFGILEKFETSNGERFKLSKTFNTPPDASVEPATGN